ncbi:nitroreductase family protein [Planctomycetota bacterium]
MSPNVRLTTEEKNKGDCMILKNLILVNRSYRRFHQESPIDESTLLELVDLARLSASGGNTQQLKYVLSCDAERNAMIFPQLAWAASLPDWPGPPEGERPSGYIVIVLDTSISKGFGCDHGIAAQSILLGATERGLGGCMIGSIQRKALHKALALPERYEIVLVIALGKPKETVVIEEVTDGSTKYWRDDKGRHHVPKRALKDIILKPNQPDSGDS